MARPRSEDKRNAILNPATQVIAVDGVSAPTARIAKIAGVAEGTLAHHDNPPVHLLLGADSLRFAEQTESARAATDRRWQAVSLSTDYSAPAGLPEFPAS
jgi:hypothetical protein